MQALLSPFHPGPIALDPHQHGTTADPAVFDVFLGLIHGLEQELVRLTAVGTRHRLFCLPAHPRSLPRLCSPGHARLTSPFWD